MKPGCRRGSHSVGSLSGAPGTPAFGNHVRAGRCNCSFGPVRESWERGGQDPRRRGLFVRSRVYCNTVEAVPGAASQVMRHGWLSGPFSHVTSARDGKHGNRKGPIARNLHEDRNRGSDETSRTFVIVTEFQRCEMGFRPGARPFRRSSFQVDTSTRLSFFYQGIRYRTLPLECLPALPPPPPPPLPHPPPPPP